MNAFRNLNGAMKKKKYYSRTEFESPASSTVEPIASRYANGEYRLVNVFVEGYDDVAFWRGIFDDYETDRLKFEISVPPRKDLAKGKRVLLDMIPQSGPNLLLCMDSDFDYLFNGNTEQSRLVNESPYVFHTYAYATENYLCHPPSLHRVCAKATKNDTLIFDFEAFLKEYSRIIHPLFLWYAYSAMRKSERIFSLIDFRTSVRLNYLDMNDNGQPTLSWLQRQVDKRLLTLEHNNPDWISPVNQFGEQIARFGATSSNIYYFMQGHTLLDNVIITLLRTVCDRLRDMTIQRINTGTKQGIALKNELSNYNNALRNVREILLDNEHYKDCFLYLQLRSDIERYIATLE